MYLGLVFFTDILCHKTGTGLIPWATLSLVPFPTSSHSNFNVPKLLPSLRHSQQCWLRFKHAHTHAHNYRISTIHTHVENTHQRYVSVRRLDFFFCGQRKSAECIIHRRNPWTLWNKRKKHGVNATDEFCGYDYEQWRSSIWNSWSNRVHGKQALKKKMLLETRTMWRQ